jgi:hypothetical protein
MESSRFYQNKGSNSSLDSNLFAGSSNGFVDSYQPKPYLQLVRRTTTRSKPILIQRVPPRTMSVEEVFVKSEYNWATWKMYHRIMEY